MIKTFTVAISAQICYHEAQVIKATYPLHSFVGYPPEPWERPLVRKTDTRFRKSLMSVTCSPLNDIFHENHKA